MLMEKDSKYTCSDYREEMTLLGLKNRLHEESLSEKERQIITDEITRLESKIGLD